MASATGWRMAPMFDISRPLPRASRIDWPKVMVWLSLIPASLILWAYLIAFVAGMIR
jgi:hypothetical protein